MFEPAPSPPDDSAATRARLNLPQRLETHAIRPAAHDYYVRWAEPWINARGNRFADTTTANFEALGRSAHLADWQKPQGPEGFGRSAAQPAGRGGERSRRVNSGRP